MEILMMMLRKQRVVEEVQSKPKKQAETEPITQEMIEIKVIKKQKQGVLRDIT
jgi:hypothetical protein